jgi:hypothetical protein
MSVFAIAVVDHLDNRARHIGRVGIDGGGEPGNFLVTGLGFPPSGLKLIIPGGKHNVPVSAQLRDGSKYEMHIAVFIITIELSMTINYGHSLTDSTQLIDHRLLTT